MHRFRKGTQLYKVRWVGCSEEEDSWEPKSKIAPQLVAEFIAAGGQGEGAAEAESEPVAPSSPGAEGKRERAPAISPSAKSPAAKR